MSARRLARFSACRSAVAVTALCLLALSSGGVLAQDGGSVPGAGVMDVPGIPGSVGGPPLPDPMAAPEGAWLPDGTAMDSGAPAIGVRPGEAGAVEVLPGVFDSQIKKCWSVPVMTGDPAEGGLARIRVELLPDGTLARPPAIIDKPAGRLGAVFAKSAATAIAACAPYALPPESYEVWKDMIVVFDTLDF